MKYRRYAVPGGIVVNSHIYLFSTMFRPSLGPNLPYIPRILETKRPGVKLDLLPTPSAGIEIEWSCTSTPSSAFMTCRGTSVTSVMRLYWGCDVLVRGVGAECNSGALFEEPTLIYSTCIHDGSH